MGLSLVRAWSTGGGLLGLHEVRGGEVPSVHTSVIPRENRETLPWQLFSLEYFSRAFQATSLFFFFSFFFNIPNV